MGNALEVKTLASTLPTLGMGICLCITKRLWEEVLEVTL